MKRLNELRAERAALSKEARALIEAHPGDKWTSDADAKVQSIYARIDAIDAELKGVEQAMGGSTQAARLGAWKDAEGRPLLSIDRSTDLRRAFAQSGRTEGARDDATIAELLRGVAGMRYTSESIKNTLTVGTDAAGGFTVPTSVLQRVLEALVPASSVMQAGAEMVLLSEQSKQYRLARVLTVPTAAWRAESGAVAESEPTFGAIDLTPRSLAFYFKVSRELLADGVNIEQSLATIIAQSIARELDRVALRGTGTAPQPRGLLNTAGIQTVTNGANGASLATLRFANLLTAVQAILGADAPMPTAAIMSPRSAVGFASLVATDNQPLMRPAMLEPVAMLATSQIPNNLTVGTSTDCTEVYVGAFNWFSYFLREQLSIQILRERFADTGEIGFVAHARVDVAPLYPSAFALITGVRP